MEGGCINTKNVLRGVLKYEPTANECITYVIIKGLKFLLTIQKYTTIGHSKPSGLH